MPDRPLAYDTETTGLRLHTKDSMFAYSTCDVRGTTDVRRLDGNWLRARLSTQRLERIMEDPRVSLVCHNVKFDLTATEKFLGRSLRFGRVIHDTAIQAHMFMNLHPNRRLKDLCWELAGIPKDDEDDVKKYARGGDYSTVPEGIMDQYQERDAVRAMVLHRLFYPRIKRNPKFLDVYRSEMELIPVTMCMEERGFMLHHGRCRSLIGWLEDEAIKAREELNVIAGWKINPDSRDQVARLLFSQLGLPILKTTPTGLPATGKNDVLLELKNRFNHPALNCILRFRSYSRGCSTVQSYMDLADRNGLIHHSIDTCRAKTGREACTDPNLQNVSKSAVFQNPFPIPARKVFMPRPGYVLLFMDYAGIEMRLLVYYSRDERLLAVMRAGGNVHEVAAEIFFGDRYRNATAERKKVLYGVAKSVNFAIPYGASVQKVAEALGLPLDEGKRRFEYYRRELSGLVGLTPKISARVRSTGQVETAFGRVLNVPRNKAYMGINYLIQGTAAEILKRAQVRVHRYLEKVTGGAVRILLPIHDELVIEYPRDMLADVGGVLRGVRELMIDFPQFDVPLDVEAEIGPFDWENKTSLEIPR